MSACAARRFTASATRAGRAILPWRSATRRARLTCWRHSSHAARMRQNSCASMSPGRSNATQASTDFQIIDEARLAEPRRCQHHKIRGAGRRCAQVARVADGEVFGLKARGVELLACGALDRRKIDICGAKMRDRLLQRGIELRCDLAL